ncbi:unnamed protein product [Jaminaea pallidilutea]
MKWRLLPRTRGYSRRAVSSTSKFEDGLVQQGRNQIGFCTAANSSLGTVSAQFQWRVVSYKRASGGCSFNILINGKSTGNQGFARTPEELNKWFGMYNGNVQLNDTEIHTLTLGPSCTVGDTVTVDLRNVTRVLEYAGGSD